MRYEHQIKEVDTYNAKLNDVISRLGWNGNLANIIVIVK